MHEYCFIKLIISQSIIPRITTILFMENPNRVEYYAWMKIPTFLCYSSAFVELLSFYIEMVLFILIKDRNFKMWLKSVFLIKIYPKFLLFYYFFILHLQ